MKKIISALLIASLTFLNIQYSYAALNFGVSTTLDSLRTYSGLTFYKDFVHPSSINADYSVGSGTGTFTVTRDATTPATYVTAAGVVTTKTDTTPRFTQGFYDELGFNSGPGLIIEGAATNLVPSSIAMSGATWTATNVTVADNNTTSPNGTSDAASLTASAGNGNILLTTAVTAVTYSVYLKRKTGTGNIQITANGGSTWTTVTLPASGWGRFQVSATSASQKCGIRIVTSGDAVYAWGHQFETTLFASTFIPTSAGAVTRNVETLSYVNSGNRTAATESFFMTFRPMWGSENITASPSRVANDTDTKSRFTYNGAFGTNGGLPYSRPNSTDSATSQALSVNVLTRNASVVTAATMSSTGDPNVSNYTNGILDGYSNTNFTSPAWGTNFYVGSARTTGSELFGTIQNVAVYSSVKSASDVLDITELLSQNPVSGSGTVFVPNTGTLSSNFITTAHNNYFVTSTFSKMVFTTSATSMTIRAFSNFASATQYLGVRINGADGSTLSVPANGTSTFTVTLPGSSATVEIINGSQNYTSSVVQMDRVTYIKFNDTATIVQPTPTKQIFVYGDSISEAATYGTSPPLTGWTALVRAAYEATGGGLILQAAANEALYDDVQSAGAATTFANEIAASFASSATTKIIYIAIGTNDYGLNYWTADNFGTQYANLLDALHTAIPTARIYCQTPLTRGTETANGLGSTTQDYRNQIATAVSTRTSYATLVDGTAILSNPTDFGADQLHPSQAAQTKYATYVENLLGI